MDVHFRRFIVGTKERPTVVFMDNGGVSEDVEDAQLFETIEDANIEIKNCDEPELFKVYSVMITVEGV